MFENFKSLMAFGAEPCFFTLNVRNILWSTNIFSISSLCFLLSAFSNISHHRLTSTPLSNMSVLTFLIFGKSERTLLTVMTGRWCARAAILFLYLLLLCEVAGGLFVSLHTDTLPSNWANSKSKSESYILVFIGGFGGDSWSPLISFPD